jgi:hypothetical protein
VWAAEIVMGWHWDVMDERRALVGVANGDWIRVFWPDCHALQDFAARDPGGVPAYSSTWNGMSTLLGRASYFALSRSEPNKSYCACVAFGDGPTTSFESEAAPPAVIRGMIRSALCERDQGNVTLRPDVWG